MSNQRGFTLIELLMAMAVFSFMLIIVLVGIINIVHVHNEALQSNAAQDAARSAMDTMVQAVRDSSASQLTTPSGPAGATANTLCLANQDGQTLFYVDASSKILYQASNCASPTNLLPMTPASLQVAAFSAKLTTSGTSIEPEIDLSLTVSSANGTTNAAGTACNNTSFDRTFCSVVTLTSGAVPRE